MMKGEAVEPIIQAIAAVITTAGGAIVLWCGWWVKAILEQRYTINKQVIDKQRQATFDYASERSLDAGRKLAGDTPVSALNDPVIAEAAKYMKNGWPDLIRDLKMDDDRIKKGLLARVTPEPTKADTIVVAKAAGEVTAKVE